MASVEQVRAGISLANDKASESIGALQQAATAIEQAQTAFAAAAEGSTQSDAEQINAMFAQALRGINEVQQSVSSAMSSAESYANRL
ncbi:hypothetical protein GCM10012275_52380 [Longimycelium tulufanense]|uniref:Uncharacterized protein n=1 Tax=Longimycelium tulufanense TaxID=907463 RepID=A0A8J3CJB1_9PSEU|nr:hypothetical protein [Longimycelium tulufanense]GGM75210.1 hypothetical protein GCM10012275_52380 [Longimycelium tulufanense]